MRVWTPTLLLLALMSGCATTGSLPDTTIEPLYMRMTDEDVRLADSVVQRALESQRSGSTLYWRNPSTGHYGAITPERTYRTKGGTYCRAYREQLAVGENSATYTDRACRDSDGFWVPI